MSPIFTLGFLSETNHVKPLPPALSQHKRFIVPIHKCIATDRQTDGQEDRQTDKQTDRHKTKQKDRQTADRQAYRETDFLTTSVGDPLC